MDLVKLITDKVEQVETSGELNKIIEKYVLSCIDNVVKDSFNWNGAAKKSIEEALKDRLNIDPEKLNLDRYQKIVTELVNKHANDTIVARLGDGIKEAVENVTKPLEKTEWTLSEIMRKFIENIDTSCDGDMKDEYGTCTLIVDDECEYGDFAHIHFDKMDGKQQYSCDNAIHMHNGKIYAAKIDETVCSPFSVSSMNGFESFMFQLYCNNVTIILDESKCETEYSRDDAY